ncbi:hypothetical protein CLIB1444_10S00584 [[Candida] jaroonii]|uniref:Uncharacterized protein n=1 Tax=[Candida] jaroonii TaxID=467808 RepID=A0ACA9YBU7_9ASCO|nr:hypothetical protein CLIB1444_10S00584 [[Candida] jaroonii]
MDIVGSLSFPLNEGESDKIYLNKVILTDDNDLERLNIHVDVVNYKRKCTKINFTNTKSQDVIKTPVCYIDNTSNVKTTPLLVKCDPKFKKLKLSLLVKYSTGNKSLVIVKTKGKDQNLSSINQYLLSKEYNKPEIEVSQINYSDLPLEANVSDFQRIIVNDGFDSQVINDDILNVFLLQTDGTRYTHLFDFKVWIDKLETAEKLQINTQMEDKPLVDQLVDLQISDYRNAFNFILDDGPEFRQALSKYEQRIPSVQKNIAILIDELKTTENSLKRLQSSRSKIIEIINNLSKLNPILPKFNFRKEFSEKFEDIYKSFEVELKYVLSNTFNKKTLDKIKSVSTFDDEHNNELTTIKKNFENQSKDYYNWMKKFLSNDKEKPESKLLTKRKNFELSKFDYLNYLSNFLNNQYMNELFENLFKFIGNDDDEFNSHYKIYLTVLLKFNAEKFKLRQMIEACKTNDELTNIIKDNNLTIKPNFDVNDDKVVTTDNVNLIFSPIEAPTSPEFNEANSTYEKSGILYALGGKGKQGWHKEWVVVKDGELREYSDWRTGNAPINKPIPIALTSIKPLLNEKRQHCFEIITPNQKFVFQAMNELEKNNWIKVLSNARHMTNTSNLEDTSKVTKSKKLHLKLDRHTVPNSSNSGVLSPTSVKSFNLITKDYLKQVRLIPESDNHICADCNSTEEVEWISMNFLNILCINCSSCHRNMGSHVSKVKSLRLDNFENESEVLLNYVNNKLHNQYLEETSSVDKSKLNTHEQRLAYIKDKYIHKEFIVKSNDLNVVLIKSVQKIDINEVIQTVSCGADCNLNLQILKNKTDHQNISLFEYSLRKYIEIENKDKKYFIISEFLLLNGIKITKVDKDLDLTPEAFKYWEEKFNKFL